ncbi:MAG: PAS domain S-box protein, partial [Ginsengibacter sp.]
MPTNNFIKVNRLSSLLVKAVILIPSLVLIDWQFDFILSKGISEAIANMNPTTAVLLILCGISLHFIQEHQQPNKKNIARYTGLLIALIAILKICDFVTEWDIGIDQIIYANRLSGNEMALNTAIVFLLIGIAFFLIDDRKKGSLLPTQLFASISFVISLLTVIGFLYASGTGYKNSLFMPMALHTALCFMLLSLGLLICRHRNGFISLMMRKNSGGSILRKFLPIGIAVPVVMGLLRMESERIQLFDHEFGAALGITLIVIIYTVLMLLLAKSLNKKDQKRKEVEISLSAVRDELSSNEIKYRNLIENSGVVMYTTSINGCITYSSSRAFQLTGYDLKELTGMHFTHLIDKEWVKEVKEKYWRQLENQIEETLVEFCIRTKEGELKWVEQSAILVSENNDPVGFQCIVRDISEKKKMEEVLRKYEMELVQNQKRLQSVLDNTTSFIYIKDLDGKYLVTNEQFKETFNVSDDKIIGHTAFDFADPQQAKRFTDYDNEVIRKCKYVEFEEIIEMADGKHHFLIT